MWVTVLVLALLAMADPLRNGTAILLLSLRRPMRNLLAFWIGGIATAIVVGLCALFVLRDVTLMVMHRVAYTVASASAGHIGVVSGVLALLIAIGLFAYRRAPLSTSGGETSALVPQLRTPPASSRLLTRSQDGLEGGQLWLAFVAGLGSATPWEYLVALTAILASGAGPGAKVGAVITFTVVAFAIAEIALVSYLAAASRTDTVMLRVHNLARAHRRRIFAAMVAVVGVYLLANGLGSV